MNQRNIELLITLLLIIISWVTWYTFAYRQYQLSELRQYDEIYIDIIANKNSIRIENAPSHIYFRIDGKITQESEFELKE